jgi:hypothetical protein
MNFNLYYEAFKLANGKIKERENIRDHKIESALFMIFFKKFFMIFITLWQWRCFKSALGLKQNQIQQILPCESANPDTGNVSRGKKNTGSRIRFRNTVDTGPDPWFAITLASLFSFFFFFQILFFLSC